MEKQIIETMDNEKLREVLNKNADYYTEKFKKTDKKWAPQLNFAALFFGPTWFFYRKMYKIAVIYAAAVVLLSCLLGAVLPAIFKADVDNYFDAKQAYTEYVNSGGETLLFEDPPYSTVVIGTHPTYQKLRDNLKAAQNKIMLINFFVTVPVNVLNILFRLFANSIYKNHITQNADTFEGGVSMKNAVLFHIAVAVATAAISVMLSNIQIVSQFTEATQTLFYWL